MSRVLNRREFVYAAGAAFLAGCIDAGAPLPILPDPAHLIARPKAPNRSATIGSTPLGLGGNRDGFLYVPPSYVPSKPAPLIVLLHGAGRSSQDWADSPLDALFGSRNIVVLAPDSRSVSWDFASAATTSMSNSSTAHSITPSAESPSTPPTSHSAASPTAHPTLCHSASLTVTFSRT